MPDHASTQGTLLKCLGYIQLTLDGLEMKKHKKVLVEIVGVSVPILLNLITEPETNSKQLRSAAEQLGTTKQFGVS